MATMLPALPLPLIWYHPLDNTHIIFLSNGTTFGTKFSLAPSKSKELTGLTFLPSLLPLKSFAFYENSF